MTTGAFIRVADGDRRLGQYEIHLLLASRGQPREDEEPVPEATPADLDAEIVQALAGRLKRTGHPRRRQLGDEEILRLLKALVRHEDRWVPSLAGLMVLGKHPQQFLPGLGVTFVAYPTSRMGEPGPGGERFLDNRRLEGPIPRIVIPALDALRRNMRRRTVVRGLFREELWEYPETAVREALVNALGHRDLSAAARGTPVQIQMYPDRLVILNPGGLFGPVTVDLLGAEGVSSARNATLMRLLEDTPVPGEGHAICENRGSGIGAMRAALRQAGMSLPVFEDRIATFQVAFSNKSLLDEETLRRLERYREHELSDTQRLALAHMLRGATLTNSTYRQLTEVDSRVATKELNGLRAMGIIERTGARRRAAYRLSSRPAEVSARPEAPARRGDRGEAILDLLEREGPLSRAEIARSLGISDGAARLWLSSLRRKNLVELTTRRPRSPRARYRISRPGRKRGHPS
jgi:ATP-dependent DNA helicase RecG